MLAPPARLSALRFGEATQYYGSLAIALNLEGKRFIDESAGTGEEAVNQKLARQTDGRGYYVVDGGIADTDVWAGQLLVHVILERAKSLGALVVEADTLEQLCETMMSHGMPGATALETLSEYNAAVLGQTSDTLFPPRRQNRFPLIRPPFYCVPVKSSITFTAGGVAVDGRMRVLRRAASSSALTELVTDLSEFRAVPIGGLFAAGADVGDISHPGYIGGLATALVTGRVAGTESAGQTSMGRQQ